jgi:ketosteroid isomerase-like protein
VRRTRHAATLALAGSLLAACTATSVTDATAIEAVLHRQQSAWNRGDIETFMAEGYWRSAELSFYSGGRVSKGFDSVLAGYIRRYREGGAETGQLEFSELDIDVLSADAAVVRGHWDVDFAAKTDVGGLFTLIFRKTDGAWRIVHDHTSSDE